MTNGNGYIRDKFVTYSNIIPIIVGSFDLGKLRAKSIWKKPSFLNIVYWDSKFHSLGELSSGIKY